MNFDIDSALRLADYGLTVVGGASILAALLPRPANGSRLSGIFKVLDFLAANWLNARNANAPRT